jgi:DNA polymerase-3 subunit alpha
MPDVDTDWPDDRRQEVIDYIIGKYGAESCCQIITFGTMKAKKAVGDVGRAIGISQREYLAITKLITNNPKITIKKALDTSPELKVMYETSTQTKYLLDIAMQVEGLPCHISTHAAGMLVADSKGLREHVPLARTDKGVVAQYAMGNLDDLGMLKLDLLGLNTLTILTKTLHFIEQNYGIKIDPYSLYRCDDLKVLEIIQKGWTDGIFQLESGGMTSFMKELMPNSIEEVIAGIALYRPGPMDMIPQYLEGKRDPSTIHYDFPELEPIFKETYGVMTYQEQCMKAAVAIAGYQKHHSDSLRKAIAKKKTNMLAQHRTLFIDGRDSDNPHDYIPGGVRMGYDRNELIEFFDKMEKFGDYCFKGLAA